MKKEFLECGKICSAHGVHGAIKIDPWCDSPKVLAKQKRVFLLEGEKYVEKRVISAGVSTKFVLMSIEGVDTREAAQAMKNTVLYLKREDIPIPKGALLIADMIGLPVIDVDTGRVYGTLSEVTDGVRAPLYTVKTSGKDVLIPAIPEFVKEIDAERGIFIRPIEGFFEDNEI